MGGGSCQLGPYVVQNVNVHDNTITMQSGSLTASCGVQDAGDNAIFTSRNNVSETNTYTAYNGVTRPFCWMNAYRTQSEWTGYGRDTPGGTFP